MKTLFLSPLQPLGPRPVGRVPSPGGPGPKPPGDLAHGAWTATLNFLLRLKPMSRVSKTLGCYHNPQSADLAGRWMVSEGGALQSHERRASRLRSAFQPLGRGARVWGPGQQAPEPCIPASLQPSRVKNSKNAPVLIGS